MSLTKTLKQTETDRDEALARVEVLINEVNALKAELETSMTEHSDAIAVLHALHAEAETQAAELTAQLTTRATEAEEALVTAREECATIAEKLEAAETALANPAFADAAVTGTDAVEGAGDGDTGQNALEQFAAIKDPAARTEFYRANIQAIHAAARSMK